MLKEQFDLLGHVKIDMFFTAVSPMRSNLMGQGRPYGGVAIMWKMGLLKNAQVQKTTSDRLCAISIDLEVREILVASVYMSCDLEDVASSDDYEEELGYLNGLVNSLEFNSKIIIGDFNGDPLSYSSSRFGKKMRKFATNNGVIIADLDHFDLDRFEKRCKFHDVGIRGCFKVQFGGLYLSVK